VAGHGGEEGERREREKREETAFCASRGEMHILLMRRAHSSLKALLLHPILG
jgi:hypothetical protein